MRLAIFGVGLGHNIIMIIIIIMLNMFIVFGVGTGHTKNDTSNNSKHKAESTLDWHYIYCLWGWQWRN